MKTLRPRQEAAIAMLRESLGKGNKRIILKLPTGAGKTVIASNIIKMALAKNKRVIFCVNAISLVDQTAQRFYEDGITDIGVIQGGHELTNFRMPVQIASIQTLSRREHMPDADLVIIDEVHNFYKHYAKWMDQWNNVPFIGLSATPYTKGLGKYFEDLITPCTTSDLIDEGWLSKFKVYAPSHPDLKGVRTVAGDYHEGDLAKVMDKAPLIADVVSTWRKLGENRPTLCYAVDRAHAKHLQDCFLGSNIACGYIDAYTDILERREIAKDFKLGRLKVICNVGVLTTGIDWDVRCIILARPTKSDILFQQIVGRSLRINNSLTDKYRDAMILFNKSQIQV
jgi:superfamily II DNA or RNA helicase